MHCVSINVFINLFKNNLPFPEKHYFCQIKHVKITGLIIGEICSIQKFSQLSNAMEL